MKTIKLLESQAHRLFELTTIGSDSPNQIKEYPGSTVSQTCPIKNTSGEIENGDPTTMDDVQRDLTNQSFMDGHHKW